MQVSKQKLNRNLEKQIYSVLFQLMADLKNEEEVEALLKDLLSEVELQVIAKRLAIVLFLDKNRSYENIKNTLKVSSATIAQVQTMMGNPGVQLALSKVKAEAWADAWTEKISNFVGKILPNK